MKKGNKVFAIIVSLCLLLTVLPLSALADPAVVAEEYFPNSSVFWRVTDDNVLTIGGSGDMPNYTSGSVPYASYKSQITSLVIEDGVTRIGNYAFYYWSDLTGDLVIPDSVVIIGQSAFLGCTGFTGTLTLGTANSRLQEIQNAAFLICSGFTGSLTIPDSVQKIGQQAFSSCSGFNGTLTLCTADSSLKEIGISAFLGCTGFTGSLTIPDSVESIADSSFKNCTGFNGTLTLGSAAGSRCEFLGSSAFYGCSGFTGGILIPDSIKVIYSSVFEGCTGLNGPLILGSENSLLQKIWKRAFYGCSGLTGSLRIPDKVKTIETYTFAGCRGLNGTLTLGTANSQLQTIEACAFSSCSGFTGDLVIPDSVVNIGNSAFYNCNGFNGTLTLGTANSHLQTIGEQAFRSCYKFTGDLTIPNSVTSIGEYGFYSCSFNGTLTLGTANSHLQTIGRNAFDNCSRLTGSLVIPDSVTSIGLLAFDKCSGFNGTLTLGTENSQLQSIGYSAFFMCSGFTGSLVIPDGVTTIGDNAFSGCSGLSGALTLGGEESRLQTIGNSAFYQCTGFDGTLTIGSSVETIGAKAFYNCYNLTGVLQIPDSVTDIGDCAFHGCAKNTDILTFFSQEERFIQKELTSRTEPAFTAGEKVNGSETYTVFCACSVHASDGLGTIKTGVSKTLPYISVTAVTNTPTALTLGIEKTFALQPVLTPDNATYPQAVYVSGDASIAAVDENGVITAHAPGTTTVTVTPADGSDIGPAVISVTVYDLTVPEKIVLAAGDTASAAAIVYPDTAVTPERTYTSSNEAAVTVDGNGLLTAVAAGTATITVTDGVFTKEIPVTVFDVTGSADHTTLAKDETADITVSALPAEALQNVSFVSSNETVISVSDTGVVTALKTGSATVTATVSLLAAGEVVTVEKTVNFTVYTPVTDIIATADRYVMDMEEIPFAEITVEVLPNDADNQNVTYTSSDPAVLEVEADGTVIALHKGTATVTITAADGYGAKTTLDFTVTHDLYALIVPPTLEEDDDGTATVETDTAKTYTVRYASSDPEILEIDPDTGEYTVKKKGTATVTAEITFEDNTSKTLTREIVVRDPHEGEFRCKRCDWYDEVKDTPGIKGVIYWLIHTITHFVQMINAMT